MGTNSKRVQTKGMQESKSLIDLIKFGRALEASSNPIIDLPTDKDTISIKQTFEISQLKLIGVAHVVLLYHIVVLIVLR